MKKSDQVREYVKNGDYKNALKIAKTFKLGISKEENTAMTRAYECMTNERFYKSMGYDIPSTIQCGIDVVTGLYSA